MNTLNSSNTEITGTNTLGTKRTRYTSLGLIDPLKVSVTKSSKSTDGKLYTGCTEMYYATATEAA